MSAKDPILAIIAKYDFPIIEWAMLCQVLLRYELSNVANRWLDSRINDYC